MAVQLRLVHGSSEVDSLFTHHEDNEADCLFSTRSI